MTNGRTAATATTREMGGVSSQAIRPIAFFDNTAAKDREGGWMDKINKRLSEPPRISTGTIALLVSILMLVFNWGGSLVTFLRGDTKQEMEIQRLQRDVESLGKSVDAVRGDLTKVLEEKKVQDAKVQGYNLGRTDGKEGHR
jgi:hypothetical protein